MSQINYFPMRMALFIKNEAAAYFPSLTPFLYELNDKAKLNLSYFTSLFVDVLSKHVEVFLGNWPVLKVS